MLRSDSDPARTQTSFLFSPLSRPQVCMSWSRSGGRVGGAPAGALREEENVSLYQSQHLHLSSHHQPSGESILAQFSFPRGIEGFLWRLAFPLSASKTCESASIRCWRKRAKVLAKCYIQIYIQKRPTNSSTYKFNATFWGEARGGATISLCIGFQYHFARLLHCMPRTS